MEEKHKKTKLVSIATQKGGVGKTTLTAILASLLHYRYDYNIIVVDVDYPQYSLTKTREAELEAVKKEERLANLVNSQLEKLNKGSYPILTCKADEAIDRLNKLDLDDIDYVLFDMPGTINQPGVLSLLACLDYVFIPIVADDIVMRAATAYAVTIKENLRTESTCKVKDVYCFWTRVDRRDRSNPFYNQYAAAIEEKFGVKLMEAYLPNSIRFGKEITNAEIVRSTIVPPTQAVASSLHLSTFAFEFIALCQK